jgi:hypothetical protein
MWSSPPRATIDKAAVGGERPMRHSLLRAYRQTRYAVGGIEVRLDCRSAAMDTLLLSYGVRQASFITAYNPFSRPMLPGWNQRMQARLAQALRRRPTLAGKGSWRGWSEAHLVVLGDVRPVVRLARRFRQNGIVILRIKQRAQLLVTSGLA